MHLSRGSLIARNSIYNLLGRGFPLIAAFFAMPQLINKLGTDRLGILSVAWMFIGYFNLFDFGVGLALTKLVAEKLGVGQEEDIPYVSWTSLSIITILGIFGGVVFALLSPWIVFSLLKIPVLLQAETLRVFYLLAFSLPFVISTSAFRGLLIAHQRFGFVNVFQSILGILTFISPLFVLLFFKDLFSIVSVMVLFRLITWAGHLLYCLKTVPNLRNSIQVKKKFIKPLLSFGGWITLNNIIDPFLIYFDRFMIGALLSMTAVAYYITPYEVITKLSIVALSIAIALFPAFTTTFYQDTKRTASLYDKSVRYVFLLLFPVVLITILLAQEALSLWLGNDFALNSYRVLQWLALGIFTNSFAILPSILLQSLGRPDIPTKIHIIELPIYLILLWTLIHRMGIQGAALAWTARVFLDMILLFILARKLSDSFIITMKKIIAFTISSVILIAAMFFISQKVEVYFGVLAFIAYLLAGWFLILLPDERRVIFNFIRNIRLNRKFA